MRLLLLADIDEFHWKHDLGQADIILSCGDIDDQVILEAAESYGCSSIFAVKGNHDTNDSFTEPIVDLHLRVQEKERLSFGGLNGSWRYRPCGHFLYEQGEVENFLSSFPRVDIFLSHNSPRGIHNKEDEVHYGFDGLRSYVIRTKPKVLIHGHQHVDKESRLDGTRIIGVYGHKLIEI